MARAAPVPTLSSLGLSKAVRSASTGQAKDLHEAVSSARALAANAISAEPAATVNILESINCNHDIGRFDDSRGRHSPFQTKLIDRLIGLALRTTSYPYATAMRRGQVQ